MTIVLVEDRQLEQSLATQKYVSGDAAKDAQTLRMVQPSRVLDMLERFVKSPWPLVLQYDNLVRGVVDSVRNGNGQSKTDLMFAAI